jgi:hypothetical protein
VALLGIALVIAVAAVVVVLRVRWEQQRKREFPGQPWMWQKRWDPAGTAPVVTSRVMPMIWLGGSAIGVCLGVVALTFVIAPGQFPAWAGIPCYVVGAGLAAFAAFRVARALRSSGSYLHFDTFPFFLGGRVSAALEGFDAANGAAWDQLTVSLLCVEERLRRRQYKGRDTSDTVRQVVWKAERLFVPSDLVVRPARSAGSGDASAAPPHVLQVDFPLPAQGKEWSEIGDVSIRWELHVTGRRRGLDLDALYEVPVYKAPATAGAEV